MLKILDDMDTQWPSFSTTPSRSASRSLPVNPSERKNDDTKEEADLQTTSI